MFSLVPKPSYALGTRTLRCKGKFPEPLAPHQLSQGQLMCEGYTLVTLTSITLPRAAACLSTSLRRSGRRRVS